MAKPSKSRPLNKNERAQIRALLGGPQTSHEVAEQFNCDVRQITGVWNSKKNGLGVKVPAQAGLPEAEAPASPLPVPETLPGPEPLPAEPVLSDSAPFTEFYQEGPPPASAQAEAVEPQDPGAVPPTPLPEAPPMTPSRQPAQRVPQGPPAPAPTDPYCGFNVIAQAAPAPGNALAPMPQLPTFRVERTQPYDGYLGTHTGHFDPNTLGLTYGGGVYRITIHIPGLRPVMSEERIAEGMYGPAKFPKVTRLTQEDDRDGREAPNARAWYGEGPRGPAGYDRYYPAYRGGPAGVPDSATTEAIRQMGTLQANTLTELSKARERGPETYLHNFYENQSKEAQRVRDEERRRDEDRRREEREREEARRRDEREREDKRRADEESRWQKERELERERHQNEMERIRLENETNAKRIEQERAALLKFEEEKRETLRIELAAREKGMKVEQEARERIAKSESDLREKSTQAELERSRKAVDEMRRQVSQDMKDQSERLAVEFELRKQNLETQQKLLGEKMELEKQIATANTTEGLVRGFQSIVGEVGKRLESVLEYKKLELGYKNPPGNVTDVPQAPPRAQQEPSGAPAAEPPQEDAQPVEEPKDMDQIISDYLKDPALRSILSEWTRQVAAGLPPSAFANFFVEAMSSEDVPQLRRATKALDMFMRTRNWSEMLKTLEPHLTAEEREVFKAEHASDYYEGFKELVAAEVDAYWEQVAVRRAQQQAARAAQASGNAAPAK